MFKNATIYRFKKAPNGIAANFTSFVPCGATQEKSIGWVPPRGHEHGDIIEIIGGQRIVKLMIETKSVPSQAIKDEVDKRCEGIQFHTGRKPGKKETREIQEDVKLALLPHAFPKRTAVLGWIDDANGLLVIDSSSQSRTDDFITALMHAVDGLTISLINTVTSPQAAMAQWLLAEDADEWPKRIAVERECVLKSTGEDAATVRFTRHHLATADVRKHVLEGKLPTQLALSWDGRLAFVLDEMLRLRKINFLDGVLDGSDEHEDRFDADVALATGTLGPAIADLIAALGGEFVAKEAA
jgi:recombination associated protein RdgC